MKKQPAKRTKKARRLEPADVLQARMEYYNQLAADEMKLGAEGSRAKIDEYLKAAQDAAKELGPYRHGRATGAEDQKQTQYVIRLPASHPFKNEEEWLLWARAAHEKSDHEMRAQSETVNETLMERWFGIKANETTRLDYKKPSDATLN